MVVMDFCHHDSAAQNRIFTDANVIPLRSISFSDRKKKKSSWASIGIYIVCLNVEENALNYAIVLSTRS